MNISEQAKVLAENIIIVHLQYPSSDVDITVLDSRYSFSDKLANFGGVFGMWAELTGFSLLGIINVCLIVLKLLLGWLTSWRSDYMPNSNKRSATNHSQTQEPYFRKAKSPIFEETSSPEQAQSPTFEEGLEQS